MDQDASTNLHAGDAPVAAAGNEDEAVNAHSAAPVGAGALDREKSEVVDGEAAAEVAEQIEEDQPIHVPLGT